MEQLPVFRKRIRSRWITSKFLFRSIRAVGVAVFLLLPMGFAFVGVAQVSAQVTELAGHDGPIMESRFSPTGDAVLTVGGDHAIRLWHLSSGSEAQQYLQHTGPVHALGISRNGQTFASGGQDNAVRVWSLPSTQPLVRFDGANDAIRSMAIDARGRFMIASGKDGSLQLHELRNGESLNVRSLIGHDEQVDFASFRQDGIFFATSDNSGNIIFWSPFLEDPIQRPVEAFDGSLKCLTFHPNNQELISADANGQIKYWRGNPLPLKESLKLDSAIADFAMSANRDSMVLGLADGRLLTANMNELSSPTDLLKLEASPLALAYLNGQPAIAVLLSTSELVLVDVTNGMVAGGWPVPKDSLTSIVAIPDGQRVISGGKDGVVRVWSRPKEAAQLKQESASISELAASTNGQWIVTRNADTKFRVWDATNQTLKHTVDESPNLTSFAMHPAAQLVAEGSSDGFVSWWNPQDPNQRGRVRLHETALTCLSFQPNTNSLITADKEGHLKCWKLPLPVEGDAIASDEIQPVWQHNSQTSQPIVRLLVSDSTGEVYSLSAKSNKVDRFQSDGTSLPSIEIPNSECLDFDLDTSTKWLTALDNTRLVHRWNVDSMEFDGQWEVGTNADRIRLSPLASSIAYLVDEKTVRVLDLAQGIVREEYTGDQPISQFAWLGTSDSQLAISRADSISLSETSLLHLWQASDENITSLSVSTNAQQLFVGSNSGELRLQNVETGEVVREFGAAGARVVDMKMTPNGQQLAALLENDTLSIWQASDGERLHSIKLTAPGQRLALSPDSQSCAVIDSNGRVIVFEISSGLELESFSLHTANGTGVAFLADGSGVVSTSADQNCLVHQIHLTRTVKLDVPGVRQMIVCGGGGQAVVIATDGRLLQVDLNAGRIVRDYELILPEGSVITCSRDQQRLAAGSPEGRIWSWNLANGSLEQELQTDHAIRALSFSQDRLKLAVVDDQPSLAVYGNPVGGSSTTKWIKHQQAGLDTEVVAIDFGGLDNRIWLGDTQGQISGWRYASPGQVRQFNHSGPVLDLDLSADGKYVVSASTDQTLRVFDTETGQQRFQLRGHSGSVLAVDLSPDESAIVSSGADGTLRLWDAVGGRQLKQLTTHPSAFYSVEIAPNGDFVAAGGEDSNIYLFDIKTGETLKIFEGHEDYVHTVTFNPEGNRIASYGYAGVLKIWDVASGELIWEDQIGDVGNNAAYSPDGSKMILSCGDGVARLIEVPMSAR